MTFEIAFTLFIVASVLVLLASTPIPTEMVLLSAMIILSLAGILTPGEALSGFGSPGVMTIAALYVVVAGLRETGAIGWFSHFLFGRPSGVAAAQGRLILAGGLLSTVINNTPVVAMFIPIAQEWSVRYGLPISKLLLPLNNVVILAGMCTLIGTSTNLVVYGLLVKTVPDANMGLLDLAWVGVPITLVGAAYCIVASRWLLPDRQGPVQQLENAREYSFEVRVHRNGPLVGRTITEVGLRNLKSAYVIEIERDGDLITAVSPDVRLQGDDRLTCVGVVDAVRDLRRIPGLTVAEDQTFTLDIRHSQRQLVELVLSPQSPLIDRTVRDTGFRTLYDAAILSISREGARIPGKVGDIVLKAGDTLLVEAANHFVEKHKHSREFLLVAGLHDSAPADFRRAPVAFGILVAMIVAATFEWVGLFEASFIAAGLMIVTGCLTLESASRSIEYQLVAGIAASFALGAALTDSGAAQLLATYVVEIARGNPLVALIALYAATVVVTELITNNAAGAMMFPLAMAIAHKIGVGYMPFVVAVMVAASCGFTTPIGYQTNLMVYGPGGYRFMDFVRFGSPLTVITGILAIAIIPRVWPF